MDIDDKARNALAAWAASLPGYMAPEDLPTLRDAFLAGWRDGFERGAEHGWESNTT